MNSFRITTALVLGTSLLTGCASVVTGTDQKMTFTSEPEGATVTVSGRILGKTPLTVDVDKGKQQPLTFEKEGFKTYTTQLSTTTSGWFWGNIICCGLLGSTTDGVSGSIHEFSPDQYYVSLTPEKPWGMSDSTAKTVKEIIIGFSDEVRADLANGSGEKVDALLTVINPTGGDQSATLAVLKKLSDENPDHMEFAKSVISFYELK